MQCESRSPALAEGHLRLWAAVHTAGRRYRRVPSAKTEEAQDSLLAAGGAGDTSSRGPGPAARPPARCPGLCLRISAAPSSAKRPPRPRSAAEAERQPRSAAPRAPPPRARHTHSHPLTPSHTTARTASRPHAPSRPLSLAPRLRLSHAPPAGSLRGGEPRLRGRGAEVSPGRRRGAHLHVPETRRPSEWAGRPARTPPEVPPLNA